MTCVTQEVKDLYHLLEHEFLPLDLASRVQPLLAKISKLGGKLSSASSVSEVQLSQYVPALEKLATLRLLQQVHYYCLVCICCFYCTTRFCFIVLTFLCAWNIFTFCFSRCLKCIRL